jgi:phospholipase D1/2
VATVLGGQTIAQHTRADDGDPTERQDYDDSGRAEAGFASSIVPTLEEKTIFERRPSAKHANGKPLFDVLEQEEVSVDPKEAEVPGGVKEDSHIGEEKDARTSDAPRVQGEPGEKELYGAPANAAPDDDRSPTENTERNDASENEQAAVNARRTLRKHLSVKVGVSPWTMPTPTPKVDPNRFHDPLDERFWKDMWVAVAVHNVSRPTRHEASSLQAFSLQTEIFRKVFRCIVSDCEPG